MLRLMTINYSYTIQPSISVYMFQNQSYWLYVVI
jgi:hypothetical protein